MSGIGKRSRGGAIVPHHKNTAEMESVIMPAPDKVTILMSQHIGKPCVPTVAVGDRVDKGQVIATSDVLISAPIHASIGGTVSEIKVVETPGGGKARAVVIEKDGSQEYHSSVDAPVAETYEDLVELAKNSGLVGLGGAGFPTYVKLKPADVDKIDTLVINGAECEPFITADYREMMENTGDVAGGIRLVRSRLNIDRVFVGIEANKPKAIEALRKEFEGDENFHVATLRARYPQGAEKVLVYECAGRTVPEGKLPADVGCIVMNVATIGTLYRYSRTGVPLITKRVTVDGGAVASPKNVIVPIGTSIHDVIEFAGGYKAEARKLLLGGPMMGEALPDDSFPVTKATNAILALDGGQCAEGKQTQCIRCGRCVQACPLSLMPASYERAVATENTVQMKALKIQLCMECGTCSYVCPAKRDLVNSIRHGKEFLRKNPVKARAKK